MDINHILKCWVSSGERNMTEREWVKRRLMDISVMISPRSGTSFGSIGSPKGV
jgi:hypothetical protein